MEDMEEAALIARRTWAEWRVDAADRKPYQRWQFRQYYGSREYLGGGIETILGGPAQRTLGGPVRRGPAPDKLRTDVGRRSGRPSRSEGV